MSAEVRHRRLPRLLNRLLLGADEWSNGPGLDHQIRRPRRLHRLCPWTSAPSVIQPGQFITGRWSLGRVAVTVAVQSLPTRQLGTKPMMLPAQRVTPVITSKGM